MDVSVEKLKLAFINHVSSNLSLSVSKLGTSKDRQSPHIRPPKNDYGNDYLSTKHMGYTHIFPQPNKKLHRFTHFFACFLENFSTVVWFTVSGLKHQFLTVNPLKVLDYVKTLEKDYLYFLAQKLLAKLYF